MKNSKIKNLAKSLLIIAGLTAFASNAQAREQNGLRIKPGFTVDLSYTGTKTVLKSTPESVRALQTIPANSNYAPIQNKELKEYEPFLKISPNLGLHFTQDQLSMQVNGGVELGLFGNGDIKRRNFTGYPGTDIFGYGQRATYYGFSEYRNKLPSAHPKLEALIKVYTQKDKGSINSVFVDYTYSHENLSVENGYDMCYRMDATKEKPNG